MPVTTGGTYTWTMPTPVLYTTTGSAQYATTGSAQYATTATTATTWINWNNAYSNPQVWPEWNAQWTYTVPQETEAQRQERLEAERERRRQGEEREARRRAIRERAEQLLLSFLTLEQAHSYQTRGYFDVRGSAGGRWRIRRTGQAGNVELLGEDGQADATYCIHPPGGLPDADAHLAQLLHLVTDEEGFRRTGNRTERRRHLAPVRAA